MIESGFASRTPTIGTGLFRGRKPKIDGQPVRRVPIRRLEVRFRSGTAVLSGTLSVPATTGRHAAVAFVHGSGLTNRAYLPDLQTLLLANGVAVLAYDKRGVAQSGGTYPGESPTTETIDSLALDPADSVCDEPAGAIARVARVGRCEDDHLHPGRR